jgi:hypothetical protein
VGKDQRRHGCRDKCRGLGLFGGVHDHDFSCGVSLYLKSFRKDELSRGKGSERVQYHVEWLGLGGPKWA